MKNNKKVAIIVRDIARKTAEISCGSASFFGIYQPKEPVSCLQLEN